MSASGILVFDKPAGITSQTAVNIVRGVFGTKRVGHTGTLDPIATGVLTVLVGSAVKAAEFLVSEDKRYEAVIKLGLATDTADVTGKPISVFGAPLPDAEALQAVLPRFTGTIGQVPPMYSALKVGGKKLYDLARRGIEVERSARTVTVTELSARPTGKSDEFILSVACSKGTYIRTLCADIGDALGCGACMAALRRTQSGRFTLADAADEKTLRSSADPESLLLPTDSVFSDLPRVDLPPFYSKLAHCGNEIYAKKIGLTAAEGQLYRLYDSSGAFFALARCERFADGFALKNVRMFV